MESSKTYTTIFFRCFEILVISLFANITVAQDQLPAPQPSNSKLMVILLSGFRWDYLKYGEKFFGEEFLNTINSSYYAHHLMPVFPSETYPNLYTILTGNFSFFSILN